MLGVRSPQRGLLEADHLYLGHVGQQSFYGFLASMRGQLFKDEEFAELYCPDNGRDSVAPSLLAIALLMRTHDKVSELLGPYDAVAEFEVEEFDHVAEILRREIRTEPGVRSTITCVVMGAGFREGRQV